jgi:predicted nucleotidyltransferase
MNRLREVLERVATELERQHQPWALLGGLAVSVHVGPRFTRDIDLAVAVPSDSAAERLVLVFQQLGYRIQLVLEQDAVGRLATVRLLPPGESTEGVVVDLMFASSGIEPEICRDAERIEAFDDLIIPVCRPGHLLALKILARDDVRRPQDLVDIRALLTHLDAGERERARSGLGLITARGFQRGRDLLADFEVLWQEHVESASAE